MAQPAPLVSRLVMEIATAAIFAALGVTMMLGALEHEVGWGPAGPLPGFFPFRLGLIVTLASVAIAIEAVLQRRRLAGESFLDREEAARVGGFGLPVIAFVAGAQVLGLYAATVIYLTASMHWHGRYRAWVSLVTALAVTAVLWILFERAFGVPLLKGPIEAWLGLA